MLPANDLTIIAQAGLEQQGMRLGHPYDAFVVARIHARGGPHLMVTKITSLSFNLIHPIIRENCRFPRTSEYTSISPDRTY